MGGQVSPLSLPSYNTGSAQASNAPPASQNFAGGGGPGGSVYTPKFGQPAYIGGFLPQADVNAINSIPNVAGGTQQMQGFISDFAGALNNPQLQQPTGYSPATTTALGEFLSQNALQMAPYEAQALQTGFDPQNALYARTAQQLTDQTRAAEAAAGVAGTPYGAGVESQTMGDFNLNWINQEQQRQQAAAATAAGLASSLGQEVAGGQQLAQAGPSFQTSILSSLIGDTTQALNPQQVAISDYLSYMGQQQQAQLTASQQNIAGVSALLDFISSNQGGGGGGSGGGKGGGGGGNPLEALGGKGAIGGK